LNALVVFTSESRFKKIGILGGMGPEATAEFYFRLIRMFQKEFGAVYDDEFPEIIIYNLPLPDVVNEKDNDILVEKALLAGITKLKASGVDFITIPCNTVNLFINNLRRKSEMKIISIVEETAKEVKALEITKVGLVGTTNTINRGLYDSKLQSIEIIKPNISQKKELKRMIINVLKGEKNMCDKKGLARIVYSLTKRGAEKVILGCTELPLICEDKSCVIDTIDVLVRSTVKEAKII